MFDQVTRDANLSSRPLLPPSLNSSICSDISSPLHSLKPPRTTSKIADMAIEPSRRSVLLLSSRLMTKL
jgi:hypothetical protein